MIEDNRDHPLETMVKMITAPVWVPIYFAGVGIKKLGKALQRRKPTVEQQAEILVPVWPVSDLERQVFAAMILAGRPVSNAELARLMGCSPGQASKMVRQLEGRIQKTRIGREVRISIPHLH